MSEFKDISNEDLRKGILDQLRNGTEPVTPVADPKDLAAREENLRSEYFLRAKPEDIDADTRAAAIRQINAALRTLTS